MSASLTRLGAASTAPRDRTPNSTSCNSTTDTSTAAQRVRLLAHLRHDSIDTITARRDLNIMMPAARVKELRERGHVIQTVQVERHDDQGRKHHRVALYVLQGGDA